MAIGLGNLLLTDEGVGVHVIARLSERAARFPQADLVDAGTAGPAVLHLIAGRRKAVLVDCACMARPPGDIRRFTPDEVRSVKALAGSSLHQGDLLQTLELSRRLGECPATVVVFGIQPACVEPGAELSPALAARLDEYAELMAAELKD